MQKTLLSFLAAFLLVLSNISAQGVFKFQKETHDFNDVIEGNIASYDFEFTNVGNQPIIITNVQASCGCTTPFWTKEPVLPGKTGTIKASYNSSGRPGTFHKTITITSNANTSTYVLHLKGMVRGKDEKVSYTAEEIKKSPKITFEKTTQALGKLEVGQKTYTKIIFKNTGVSPLDISDVQSACQCTSFSVSKVQIPTGESATLLVAYTPHNKGHQTETLYITSNDKTNPLAKFTLQADVVESLSSRTLMQENRSTVPFK